MEIAAVPTVTSPQPVHVPVTLSGFGAADRLVAIVSLTDATDLTVEHGYGGFADQSGHGLL